MTPFDCPRPSCLLLRPHEQRIGFQVVLCGCGQYYDGEYVWHLVDAVLQNQFRRYAGRKLTYWK